jgi:hypothetical protein
VTVRSARSASRRTSRARQRLEYVRPTMTSPPPVQDQLVLELEVWVLGAERPDVLPSRGSCRLSLPLYQNLVHPAGQPKLDCSFGHRSNCTVMQERQRRWFRRRRPMELLEQPHMKHVVDAGAGRQSQADSDFIDELGDAV